MKMYIWLLAIALLLIPLVLAACSTGTSSSTPSSTTSTSASIHNIPVDHGNPVDATHQNCAMCHNGAIAPFPEDHAGRANDTCGLCHKLS
jgi:hypothetical protein